MCILSTWNTLSCFFPYYHLQSEKIVFLIVSLPLQVIFCLEQQLVKNRRLGVLLDIPLSSSRVLLPSSKQQVFRCHQIAQRLVYHTSQLLQYQHLQRPCRLAAFSSLQVFVRVSLSSWTTVCFAVRKQYIQYFQTISSEFYLHAGKIS